MSSENFLSGSGLAGTAAQLLNDIRVAVGGKKGDDIARKHAVALKKRHPTLRLLAAALRRQGLI